MFSVGRAAVLGPSVRFFHAACNRRWRFLYRRSEARFFSVRMECLSRDGSGDAVLDVDTAAEAPANGSVFGSAEEATRFLLGMRFSADSVRGRVRVQPIDHRRISSRRERAVSPS